MFELPGRKHKLKVEVEAGLTMGVSQKKLEYRKCGIIYEIIK